MQSTKAPLHRQIITKFSQTLMNIFLFAVVAVTVSSFVEAAPSWRVVNGTPARPGQFPFVVSLYTCTASIINQYTILTAGHCVCKGGPSTIVAGVLKNYDYSSTRQEIRVNRIHVHPNYESSCGYVHPYDAAIIKLSSPLQYNQHVQPIGINCGNAPQVGSPIISMGFGQDENSQSGTMKFGHNRLTACGGGYLCSPRDGNHIYFGDSGGPVVRQVGSGYEQIGVNSGIGGYSLYAATHLYCPFVQQYL